MRIGVPAELRPGETMVAATPKTVGQLIALGHQVVFEAGAGRAARLPDEQYAAAGAELADADEVWRSDLVLKVRAPLPEELPQLREGQLLACLLDPARSPELLAELAARGETALSLDAVPRISRAQALDVLSSMANIAGYRAVIEAANSYGSLLNGQVTAAGKVPPARVFVVGAGVAGLAAIGTASSLGAQVYAFDVRPEVAEQVESMGAEFTHLPGAQDAEASSDGYAKELTADQEQRTAELYADQSAAADIVITTALIPGRPAPTLITAAMVAAMKPGSVIVDLAAPNGGNCELTVRDQVVVSDNGVIIIGYTDLAGRLPTQASQLFGTNLVNLVKLLTPAKDGQLVLDLDDPVQRSMLVADRGEVTWPPPPVTVSAAPAPVPAAKPAHEVEPVRRGRGPARVALGTLGVLLAVGLAFTPSAFLLYFTIFALAVVVGYYVISNVTHALHTPLMTETNAISGIILIGALLQIGSDNLVVRILAFIALTVASINIFGGFLVANRMLAMFSKD
ncbi:NAD(P) transhydrogenase subunit alpha [Propionibacteriaceae bacterium ES.041]|uniref:proton-translocating NAD(P)(+) transhydrogenase n=1 Tax=Enemella evansiae TaxID=2016499 RepID=A0A255GC80_9ACTN|nr:Re/Si-specific NAD(P)(+) transhydrogenase subunit alpha [Enemella evansiae]OYN97731.1 NAD(P)(+) transhydrogenase (Re/Si-specific) subunit alpha [Enemella evansiae]OYO13500.1 NAD(P)(+) transhydrogenase (Re/Si-specific) subunit alpha [Enemella evansiae]PFG68327.1 NAD(P) transhydrogenase subunit alpha [Propionibacteriaceae bacterium ES.041]